MQIQLESCQVIIAGCPLCCFTKCLFSYSLALKNNTIPYTKPSEVQGGVTHGAITEENGALGNALPYSYSTPALQLSRGHSDKAHEWEHAQGPRKCPVLFHTQYPRRFVIRHLRGEIRSNFRAFETHTFSHCLACDSCIYLRKQPSGTCIALF